MVANLFLTVTRACHLRCSYCPTAKEGWPSLSRDDALRAVDIFCDRFGGGDLKIFGGEPLLAPEPVRAVLEEAQHRPEIRRVTLSTNGLKLDEAWLDELARHDKAVLTLSIDGRPEDHRRHRLPHRAVTGSAVTDSPGADTYAHLLSLLPALLRTPRLTVTQTIAPDRAAAVADNFAHLCGLGFHRFNLLPAYYVAWEPQQIEALGRGFAQVADAIRARWQSGQPLYLKNLYTWAPTPLFNSGLVVDSDGSIHASNVGIASSYQDLLAETRMGDLDHPPSAEALASKAAQMPALIAARVPDAIWRATVGVDDALGELCRGLYGDYVAYKKRRRQVA